MKLIIIFLSFFTLQVSANGHIQKITIAKKSAHLTDIFKSIEQQTGLLFFCDKAVIQKTEPIDIAIKNATLDQALSACLKGQGLIYSIIKNTVMIKPEKEITYFQTQAALMRMVAPQPPPKEVHGRVANKNGEPLQNISILVAGTKIGTTTDVNGRFSLTVPSDKNIVLEISGVGFQTKRVNVGKQTEINVTLEESVSELDEIVIGYGTVKKRDLTGSVVQVKGADLDAFSAANPLLTLSGRAAGVQVKQVSGQPGELAYIRIRGSNSIQGSNDPLYVIDGIPTDNPYVLNNADIASMEILKDASSTAIYGSRGANGVVIITTKGGQIGPTKISLESRYSTQQLRKKLPLLNAEEYSNYYNLLSKNSGGAVIFTPDVIKNYGEGTDWQDVIFRSAPTHDHTLNISGGNAKTRFSVSGSYFNQQGIIENSSYERYSARMNFHHKINDRLDFDLSSIVTRSDQTLQSSAGSRLGGSLIAAVITAPPIYKPYDSLGNLTIFSSTFPFVSPAMENPLLYTKLTTGGSVKNDINTTGVMSFRIIDGLLLKIRGAFFTRDIRSDFYQALEFNQRGSASASVTNFTSALSENTLEYNRNFNKKHSFNILVGQTYQNFITKGLSGSATDLLSDVTGTYNLASSRTPGIPGSSYKKSVLLSYLGRINYNYDNLLLLTGSLRADGASKYSIGQKWGYFPSAAIALNLKEKTLLKNIDFITALKVRSSWGKTGSQAINEYGTLNLLQPGYTIFGGDIRTVTLAPSNTLPFKLKWETTAQSDVGLDATFFSGRYRFVADYYKKVTSNLLSIVSMPTSTGYSSSIQNIGAMQNQGVEFSIDASLIKRKELKWDVSGNISFNRNKILELYGGKDIITGSFNFGGAQFVDNIVLLREGEPLGMFYGYVEDGYTKGRLGALSVIKYKDLNNDGVINISDKVKVGDPNPKFTYGFNTSLTYKGFSLAAYFQGVYGNDIANISGLSLYEAPYRVNTFEDIPKNLATSENPNAKYPQPEQRNLGLLFSKRFIEDGSYLRMQHLELGYTLQKGSINAYFFVSGENLLTITKYSWWDPEVNATGVDIVQGVDWNTYPRTKSITVGTKLSF